MIITTIQHCVYDKTVETNAGKVHFSAETMEKKFGTRSLIENTQVNQFVEDHFECCYFPEDPDGYRSDTDEDDDLVAGQISNCA